ncbi:MAG: sulfotransferase [Ferrimonas sp.]
MPLMFIVGFPRSGTTFLQTLLMTDSQLCSVPETHVFTQGYGVGWRRAFGALWVSAYCSWWLWRHLKYPRVVVGGSREQVIRRFFALLANRAQAQGQRVLLEKTPGHLEQIARISALYPHARFVHVIRQPQAALASMQQAAAQWGDPASVEQHAQRWLNDLFISYRYRHHPQHCLVHYDDLLRQPEQELTRINRWAGLQARWVSPARLAEIAQQVVGMDEHWKANNLSHGTAPKRAQVKGEDGAAATALMGEFSAFLTDVVQRHEHR